MRVNERLFEWKKKDLEKILKIFKKSQSQNENGGRPRACMSWNKAK